MTLKRIKIWRNVMKVHEMELVPLPDNEISVAAAVNYQQRPTPCAYYVTILLNFIPKLPLLLLLLHF
jgi:hypothetical protein